VAGVNDAPTKSDRQAKPTLERQQPHAGTSAAPPASTQLQATINKLATPIAPDADVVATQAELEARRQEILRGADEVARIQQEMNITLREYNIAHGFASVNAEPSRVAGNRLVGRNLDKDLRREAHSGASVSASFVSAEKPKYSTPDKTLRATQAAADELDHLTGDALLKQQAQVRELLAVAAKQTAEIARAKTGAGASHIVHSVGGAKEKSNGQASSPHLNRKREKQITLYDPVLAGK
jgi:hypothetical protein